MQLLLLTKMSHSPPLSFLSLSSPLSTPLPPLPPSPPLYPPKKIDEENEANLLAVLTETLDSIPVDEDGLPSFEALADGDVTNASDQSCPSSPDGSPRTPEPEEPSLVTATALPYHDSHTSTILQFRHELYPRPDLRSRTYSHVRCVFGSPKHTSDKTSQQDQNPSSGHLSV